MRPPEVATACLDINGTGAQAGELAGQLVREIQRADSRLHAWAPLLLGYGCEVPMERAAKLHYYMRALSPVNPNELTKEN